MVNDTRIPLSHYLKWGSAFAGTTSTLYYSIRSAYSMESGLKESGMLETIQEIKTGGLTASLIIWLSSLVI